MWASGKHPPVSAVSDEFYRIYGINHDYPVNTTAWRRHGDQNNVNHAIHLSPTATKGADDADRVSGDGEDDGDEEYEQDELSEPGAELPADDKPVWKRGTIARAVVVRVFLIAHQTVTSWRVTEVYGDNIYWLLVLANLAMIIEGAVVIFKRQGIDYAWWCPCFFVYLSSTLPLIWLLQISEYDTFNADRLSGASGANDVITTTATTTTMAATAVINSTLSSFTTANMSSLTGVNTTVSNNTVLSTTTLGSNLTSDLSTLMNTTMNVTAPTPNTTTMLIVNTAAPINEQLQMNSEVWLIIIEETLVYLLVLGRWVLPRGDISREFLADLLLEFLAIASDIMELLAVFDEAPVRSNLKVTYWIMAVWSASFIQFIPVLVHKRMFRRIRSPRLKCIAQYFGQRFIEVTVTLMGIFLQDGPFLVLRLYIMIELKLITYSLVFFVLKNAVTLVLLFYRLCLLCYRMPCFRRTMYKEKTLAKINAHAYNNSVA